jgi:UDP-N-acetylglucosamine 2-epimerase (non-hydrolysing)
MKNPLIYISYGTRPEAIKLAPLILRLRQDPELDIVAVSTGQHLDLLDQVHDAFEFKPDMDLEVYSTGQSLNTLSGKVLSSTEAMLAELKPDFVIVQGDTTSAFASALAAFNSGVAVGHLEAGLRSGDLTQPYPEEGNRKMISAISSLHFTPTQEATNNLLSENVGMTSIFQVGNTVIDALQDQQEKLGGSLYKDFSGIKEILVTAHRRENWGAPMVNISVAIKTLLARDENLMFNVVLHANPSIQEDFKRELGGLTRVNLLQPLKYRELVKLMSNSWLVLTDSGGIQEEAPSLGIPVLVLREVTERPEGVSAGNAVLVGTNSEKIVEVVENLINEENFYSSMSSVANPYGDGKASFRVIQALKLHFRLGTDFQAFNG